MKNGISQVIVNVEAQEDEPTGYDSLNRAVFYVSRLVSSQKERDFVKINYNDIKRVFSIWVCMNMDGNSMDYVHLADDKLLGSYPWKGGLDLMNIVLIGIANELPEHDDKYELHRLLSTLLSMEMSVDEKIRENATDNAIAGVIMNMHRKGYTLEQIAECEEKTVDEAERIIKERARAGIIPAT